MSINFLHPVFGPTLKCSVPCVDGHDISNLLSRDMREQDCGLLPERFIKPPINIECSFPCEIELHRVVFSTVVGAQKTSTIELFSHSGYSKLGTLAAKNRQLRERRQHTSSRHPEPEISLDEKLFLKISPGNVRAQQKDICCFTNSRFKQREMYADLTPMVTRHNQDADVANFSLFHHKDCQLSRVSSLNLRLLQSAPGKLCALKRLEVWGQPAFSCSPETVADILKKHSSIFEERSRVSDNPRTNPVAEVSEDNKPGKDSSINESTGTIPTEFLDPVTMEVMSIPMLVPSGQTVDQHTLEKHNAEEAKWGRPPNDPFTGVPFTATKKPIPNLALKTRIDHFLLQNSDSLHHIAQTVGSAAGLGRQSGRISTLLSRGPQRKCESTITNRPVPHSQPINVKFTGNHSNLPAIQPQHIQRSVKRKSERDNGRQTKRQTHSETKSVTASNLDDAIANTLQSLPSYLKPSQSQQPTDNILKCSSCQKTATETLSFYQLQCKHAVCRNCLVGHTPGGTSDVNTSQSADGAVFNMTSCVVCGTVIRHQLINRLHAP